jgi:2-hydroxychromene-2-carboxylate isomerase
MTKYIDFYFDFISPYSYLAFKRIKSLKNKDRININYKPILLGGLHNLAGISAPAFNERKMKNMKNDCELIAKKII